MTEHLTLAQERLRDLDEEQRREGRNREAFGGGYSYEDSLARLEVDDASGIGRLDGNVRGIGRLAQFGWSEELEQKRKETLGDRQKERVTFEATFSDIFVQAYDLLIARQRKYGPDNITRQGMWGVITRIADDKIARIKRAFNGRIVSGQIALDPVAEGDADDTFEDACLDLMNYAAILLALKRGVWGRPLAEEVGK